MRLPEAETRGERQVKRMTVLGGIWADQSWGRFWGWDPKENGALLIVLWNAMRHTFCSHLAMQGVPVERDQGARRSAGPDDNDALHAPVAIGAGVGGAGAG